MNTGSTEGTVTGQLGGGASITFSSTPLLLTTIAGTPIEVACGALHTLVLTKEGHVFGFGDDATYGAVGNGKNEP